MAGDGKAVSGRYRLGPVAIKLGRTDGIGDGGPGEKIIGGLNGVVHFEAENGAAEGEREMGLSIDGDDGARGKCNGVGFLTFPTHLCSQEETLRNLPVAS